MSTPVDTPLAFNQLLMYHSALVVGAGGAGLRAALGLAQSGLETACLTKLVSFNPRIMVD